MYLDNGICSQKMREPNGIVEIQISLFESLMPFASNCHKGFIISE